MGEAKPGWKLRGLGANEPWADSKDKLALFGQFVGDWVGEATFLKEDGSEVPGGRGEVHFNWILDGRAIQDVWVYEDVATKRMSPAGTTIRFYDSKKDNWQSTWISPRQNTTLTFIGQPVDGEIVLETRNPRGQKERWIFFDIASDAFSWRGEVSRDEGITWRRHSLYHFKREETDEANQ